MNQSAGEPGIRLQRRPPHADLYGATDITVRPETHHGSRGKSVAGMPKEPVSAMLWPESDRERARDSLHQSAYVFRQVFGAEAIVVRPTNLRLNEQLAARDAGDFRLAMATRDAGRHRSYNPSPFSPA